MRSKYLLVAAVLLALAGCDLGSSRPLVPVAGGDAQRGRAAIAKYGCGACHTIQGISGARGLVGPPLTGVGGRQYIGGVLSNTPENLVRWIHDPHAVDEKTAMPALGVGDQDAADMASYLYSIR